MGKNSSKEKGAAGGSHGFNDELLHDKDSAHIKGYKPVRPRRFVDGVWEYEDELAADQIATVAADLSASPTVSALTFNIWFNQQLRFADRMEAVLAIVEERKPDFVCLQEVIPRFVREHLVDNAFVRDHYSITSVDGETLGGYGVMILARPAALRPCNLVYLNSGMDRQLVAGLYAVGGVELAVGTIHLESLGNPDKRASQLAAVADFLSEAPHALVMGDFNFCSYRNFRVVEGAPLEQEVMANVFGEYTDVWAAVRDTDAEPGYTFDSDVNPNITQDEVMRYDRLCVKSAGDVFAPIAIDLVGNAPIEGVSFMRNIEEAEDHPDNSVWPSDHLGLYAEFEVAIATATDAVASATEAVATTQPRLDDTDDFADEVD